jgi:hypothetical protein
LTFLSLSLFVPCLLLFSLCSIHEQKLLTGESKLIIEKGNGILLLSLSLSHASTLALLV